MRVDVQLQLHEISHALDVGILVDQLTQGLALHLLGRDGPVGARAAHFQQLGNVDASLIRTRQVERLVQDVRRRLVAIEDLDDAVTTVKDHLVVTLDDGDLILGKFHGLLLF